MCEAREQHTRNLNATDFGTIWFQPALCCGLHEVQRWEMRLAMTEGYVPGSSLLEQAVGWEGAARRSASSHLISHEARGEGQSVGLQLARLGGHRAPSAWICSAHSRDVDKWAKHLACVGDRPAFMKHTGGLKHKASRFLRSPDV